MSLLDNLTSIVKIDLSKLKEIKLLQIDNRKTIIVKDSTLFINTGSISGKEKDLVNGILHQYIEEGNVLLEEKSLKLLNEVQQADKKASNQELLNYFKGKIPTTDLEILRASLIIKEIYEMHQPVNNLKADLRQRYGQRGSNISNLTTAGYFISLIKPLYEEMVKQTDFSNEKFQERYQIIVTQYTFAVFVSSAKSEVEFKKEVEAKIALNKKYGIKQLNIHGLGHQNVEKIEVILQEIKPEINWPPEIDSDGSYINVKITF
jgi:hypothetical protein